MFDENFSESEEFYSTRKFLENQKSSEVDFGEDHF